MAGNSPGSLDDFTTYPNYVSKFERYRMSSNPELSFYSIISPFQARRPAKDLAANKTLGWLKLRKQAIAGFGFGPLTASIHSDLVYFISTLA